jgi:hypothetical protein
MQLENFGCGGATTDSILTFNGTCGVDAHGAPAATDAGPHTLGEINEIGGDGAHADGTGTVVTPLTVNRPFMNNRGVVSCTVIGCSRRLGPRRG